MKKILFPLLLISLLFISATKEPSRFSTPEEMAQALLNAFQQNDSIRFLEIYPTHDEAYAALVTPWKDSADYENHKKAVEKYYKNNNAYAQLIFQNVRQQVIESGIYWNAVKFKSVIISKENKRSPGIDYLYRCWIDYQYGDRQIELRLTDVMQTKTGWNCGLNVRVSNIDISQAGRLEQIQKMEIGYVPKSDSLLYVTMMQNLQKKAAKADSINAASSRSGY